MKAWQIFSHRLHTAAAAAAAAMLNVCLGISDNRAHNSFRSIEFRNLSPPVEFSWNQGPWPTSHTVAGPTIDDGIENGLKRRNGQIMMTNCPQQKTNHVGKNWTVRETWPPWHTYVVVRSEKVTSSNSVFPPGWSSHRGDQEKHMVHTSSTDTFEPSRTSNGDRHSVHCCAMWRCFFP